MKKLVFLFSFLFSSLAFGAPQTIGGQTFNIIEEDPAIQLSFGSVIEYGAGYDEEQFGDNDVVLVVDGEVFYMKSAGLSPDKWRFSDSAGNVLDPSALKTCCGDETKVGSLIEILKPGVTTQRNDLDIRLIKALKETHSGISKDNCDLCLVNNNCVIKPDCKNKCNYDAGLKCCDNEYGTPCRQSIASKKGPTGPLSCTQT